MNKITLLNTDGSVQCVIQTYHDFDESVRRHPDFEVVPYDPEKHGENRP